MKTFVITTSPIEQSISNYFFELGNCLHQLGNKVIIITDKNRPHKLPKPLDENQIFLSWPSYRPTKIKDFVYFYKICKQFKPDCCITQFGATNLVTVVSKLLAIKDVFVYWHTMFKQLTIDNQGNRFKSMVLLIRKRLILKYFTTHILTNSAENKKDLTTNYQIPQEKITVMPYLIKDFFIDLKFGDDRRNELIISFVARLHKSKGQENIINEMPLLVSKIPNIKLFIIGDGPEKNYLEQLIVEKKLKENVVLTGAISQNKLFNYMYQSFAHISASEEEAFGLVNVEALAAGTPIIVNKVGGIKDILIEGINGYAFNPKQQGDLTDKLMILLKGDWIHYSLNARNSFLNNYLISQENLLNQLKTLESIMQNNKALTKQ